jgi:predicted O-methyltransferase YrrM
MKFTSDWFSQNIGHLSEIMKLLPQKKSFLEIGSYEGRSSVWFLDQLDDDGLMVCIDTWEGGAEHTKEQFEGTYELFNVNINEARKPNQNVTVIKDTSKHGLAELIYNCVTFDFIYIDGSHHAEDVLTDACMAFSILNEGGVMVFDDYQWENPNVGIFKPKLAIDFFTTVFAEKCKIVYCSYQLAIIKI